MAFIELLLWWGLFIVGVAVLGALVYVIMYCGRM